MVILHLSSLSNKSHETTIILSVPFSTVNHFSHLIQISLLYGTDSSDQCTDRVSVLQKLFCRHHAKTSSFTVKNIGLTFIQSLFPLLHIIIWKVLCSRYMIKKILFSFPDIDPYHIFPCLILWNIPDSDCPDFFL